MIETSIIRAAALRLNPDCDLKKSLISYCESYGIQAACIISCVGSLRSLTIRFANKSNLTVLDEKFEIISLAGTISQHEAHLHISISDGEGKMLGGHLAEGSLIYTTCEIVIGILDDVVFKRELDSTTGYKELKIYRK